MFKTSIFRSKKLSSYEDNYGGNAFDNYYYNYILFRDNSVYRFHSSPMMSSSKLKLINSFEDKKTIGSINLLLKNASKANFNLKLKMLLNLDYQLKFLVKMAK
jgi:hypothetical protein